MSRRRLALVAAALALTMAAVWLRSSEGGRAPDAARLPEAVDVSGAYLASELAPALQDPEIPQDPSIPQAKGVSERSPSAVLGVESTGAQISRAERRAEEEAKAAEARANRQRLLFETLSDLSAAADRAEREGNPTYAAALRRRAEVLGQGLRSE